MDHPIDRRMFLRRAAAISGGFAAPSLLGLSSLSDPSRAVPRDGSERLDSPRSEGAANPPLMTAARRRNMRRSIG